MHLPRGDDEDEPDLFNDTDEALFGVFLNALEVASPTISHLTIEFRCEWLYLERSMDFGDMDEVLSGKEALTKVTFLSWSHPYEWRQRLDEEQQEMLLSWLPGLHEKLGDQIDFGDDSDDE